MKKTHIVISTQFHPNLNKWSGLKVEMNKSGTHNNYNVVYNGVCSGEYFDSEMDARNAARDFTH